MSQQILFSGLQSANGESLRMNEPKMIEDNCLNEQLTVDDPRMRLPSRHLHHMVATEWFDCTEGLPIGYVKCLGKTTRTFE